jgi:GAF domain-containing protein
MTFCHAPLPANEIEGLRTLRRFNVLDTPRESLFDALTLAAAHICGTPIALISRVDERRQWFKSRIGLETRETPREIAFCAHALLQDELLEVSDALADLRFAGNPLAIHEPSIRSTRVRRSSRTTAVSLARFA